jgi:hypothetical protein
MADEPEEIEVDITEPAKKEGDKPETGTPEVVADAPEKPEKPEILTPEEGVDKLKANLEATKRERDEEARKRREAESRATNATKQIQDAELREVTGAIDIVTRDLDTARANYRTARANGDVDAEIAATEQIADAKGKLQALEHGKMALEQRAKQPPRTETPGDPVEALAGILEKGGNVRSAAWVRKHPEYAKSDAAYNKMLGAHYKALSAGHAVESDAYFDFIDGDLGHKQSPAAEVTKTNPDPNPEQPLSSASRPVAPPAAPVSRQPAGSPRQGTVRLSKAQAEAAEFSFPDVPKAEAYRLYAKNLQAPRN